MSQSAGFAGAPVSAPVNVLGGVLMSLRAVSLINSGMPTLPNHVQTVLGRGVPAQIFQPIVGGVMVRMMTRFLTWGRRSDKGRQDQARNLVLSPGIPGKGYGDPAIIGFDGRQDSAVDRSWTTIAANHAAREGSHSALVGNLIGAFVTGDRQPSFCHNCDLTVRTMSDTRHDHPRLVIGGTE